MKRIIKIIWFYILRFLGIHKYTGLHEAFKKYKHLAKKEIINKIILTANRLDPKRRAEHMFMYAQLRNESKRKLIRALLFLMRDATVNLQKGGS